MVGHVKSIIKLSLIPARDSWRAQTKPCAHQGPGNATVTPPGTEPELPEYLTVSCRGMSQQWPAPRTGALAAAVLAGRVCGVNLGKVSISPTIEPLSRRPTSWWTANQRSSHFFGFSTVGPTKNFPAWDLAKGLGILRESDFKSQWDLITEISTGLGKDSWRAQAKSCVHQDPGEMSSNPTRDWARLTCECPEVSSGQVSEQWPATGSGVLAAAVLEGAAHWHKSSWRKSPLDLTRTITLPWRLQDSRTGLLRSIYREEVQPYPEADNWIRDLLRMALHTRARFSFPHSQSLPSGSLHKPLTTSIRRQSKWKPQLQKTNQNYHMDHRFV